MKLLALDSSGLVASVAILDGETLVAEYTLNYKKTHSQTLLPMLDEIVKMTQTELSEMDAIAVAAGPSFCPSSLHFLIISSTGPASCATSSSNSVPPAK